MRSLFSILSIFVAVNLSAQYFCHTTEAQNAWFAKHPELKAIYEKYQLEAAQTDRELFKTGYVKNAHQKSSSAGTYTIPVVFHILHLGGTENISDAQVIDAVNILTRDFNAKNADTSNVVVQFKNMIGNAQIDFVLATRDPNGNCTNGIVRHWDANTDWSGAQQDYKYSWPNTRYLNIYVVRTMGGGAAGYTFLPGSGVSGAMDAIVILSGYVGSIGTGNIGTSRALSHEVGHWLNLPHVWGGTNQPGVACGDDGVSDTPLTKGYTSCNLTNNAICTPGIVENVQNYMDYAYCQRMFTIGQATRMQNAINSPINGRNNLSSPANLALTGVTNPLSNCAPLVDINALPSLTVCSGKALTLASFTSNAAPTSYSWSTDDIAFIANPTAGSTSITFLNPGLTIVTCEVANANGSNTQTLGVVVENGYVDITSSNTESFEGSPVAFPTTWAVVNPTTPNEHWEIGNGISGSHLTKCAYVPGETLSANSLEILQSPAYDFKNNPNAQFSFKYAYARQSSANADVFKVQASKNCGGNWVDIWVPTNGSLAQGSGGTTPSLYISPLANEWKTYILTDHPNFAPFKNEENVHIRFYFQEDVGGTGHGNRFYLDQVMFSSPTGVNELTRSIDFSVFPNPGNGVFNVAFTLSNASMISYKVVSVTGATISEVAAKEFPAGMHKLSINENSSMAPGVYIINFELNGVNMSRKLIVE